MKKFLAPSFVVATFFCTFAIDFKQVESEDEK